MILASRHPIVVALATTVLLASCSAETAPTPPPPHMSRWKRRAGNRPKCN